MRLEKIKTNYAQQPTWLRRRNLLHHQHRWRALPLVTSLLLFVFVEVSHGWVSSSSSSLILSSRRVSSSHLRPKDLVVRNNFLDSIGEFMSGGKLEVQDSKSLPYGDPLGQCVDDTMTTLAVQERALSFTGEDFDVYNAESTKPYCKVRGAMLHLPGKDKMRISSGGSGVLATLDRKLIAMTATYDIYRGDDNEKIGWLEKAPVALTDTFVFHAQADQSRAMGPFKPPAAFQLEGDFIDRRFVMKNAKGQVVAKVSKDSWIQFDAFNHYQIQIAPGMDPILVVACACAIDEEFDEEHQQRKEREQRQ